MDPMPPRERDYTADLESGGTEYEQLGSEDSLLGAKLANSFTTLCSGFVCIDGSNNGEKGTSLSGNLSNASGALLETVNLSMQKKVEGGMAAELVENKSRKERRKTTSAKKPPRPPRPPKALSLDAADQKLIKEISELAMIKRARIERMKTLKKMKVVKASSSSTGNLFAMLFTLLFCLVIIFQGMSPGSVSPTSFQGSPESDPTADSGFISVHDHISTAASDASIYGSGSGFPSLAEEVSGSDPGHKASRKLSVW